jgi:hypothetical protein
MTLSFNKLNEIAAIYESIADSEQEQLDEQGNESNMAIWAKANPKLAAAKAERDRTRGTSATTNPLMKDMKSGLPAPKPSPAALLQKYLLLLQKYLLLLQKYLLLLHQQNQHLQRQNLQRQNLQ